MSDIPTTTARLVLDVGDAEQQIESLGTAVDETAESFENMAEPAGEAYVTLEEGTAIITDHVAAQLELAGATDEQINQYLTLTEAFAAGQISQEDYTRAGTALSERLAEQAEVQGTVSEGLDEVNEKIPTATTGFTQLASGLQNATQLGSALPGELGAIAGGLGEVTAQSQNAILAGSGLWQTFARLSPQFLAAGIAVGGAYTAFQLFTEEAVEPANESLIALGQTLRDTEGFIDFAASNLIERIGTDDESILSQLVGRSEEFAEYEELFNRAGVSIQQFQQLVSGGQTATDFISRSPGLSLILDPDQINELRRGLREAANDVQALAKAETEELLARSRFLTEVDRDLIRGQLDDIEGLNIAREREAERISDLIINQESFAEGTEEAADARAAYAQRSEELSEALEAEAEQLTGLELLRDQDLSSRIAISQAIQDGILYEEEFIRLNALTGLSVAELGGILDEQVDTVEAFNQSVVDAGVAFRDQFLGSISDAFGQLDEDAISFEELLGIEGDDIAAQERLTERLDSLLRGGYDALAQRLAQAPPEAQEALLDQLDISNILDIENLETRFEEIDADRVASGLGLQDIGGRLALTLSDQVNTIEEAFTPDLAKAARDEVANLSTNLSAWTEWTTAANAARTEGQEIGESLGDGMAAGITASTGEVEAAAAALGAAAQAALDSSLEIESPSQTAAESGRNFTAGFVQGATEGDTINVNVTSPSGSDPQVFGRSVGVAVRSVRRR